jgi:transposase
MAWSPFRRANAGIIWVWIPGDYANQISTTSATASSGVFCLLSTGCQWSALPKDLPPKSTVHDYFVLLDRSGALERMHEALYVTTREREGREVSPTAAIIDSQSAKAAQKGAPRSIRKASTRARKSSAANAMCSSTRSACS